MLLTETEKLGIISNQLHTGILLETDDRKISFVNKFFLDLFQVPVPVEMMIGIDCGSAAEQSAPLFVNPALFIQRTNSIIENRLPVLGEEWEMLDGRFLERDYQPIFSNGIFNGHIWNYKNITDRKKLEIENLDVRNFYKKVLDNIPADIAIFSKDHRYLYVNKTGIKNDEIRNWIIGKKDEDYFNFRKHLKNNYQVSRRNYFNKVLKTKNTIEFLEEQLSGTKQRTFNLRYFSPILNEQQDIEYIVGYGLNITRMKETEIVLDELKNKLHNIVESLEDIVLILTEEMDVEFANSSWVQKTGYSLDITLGRSIKNFLQPGDIVKLHDHISETGTDDVHIALPQIQLFTARNTELWMQWYISKLREEHRVKYILVLSDITIQKNALEELMENVTYEKNLNEIKSAFVNMVSHELRTPLSVIRSSAEIMDMSMPDKGYQKFINNITGEVDRITELLNEVLLISKIEAGKINTNFISLDVCSFFENIIQKNFEPWTDQRSLRFLVKGNREERIAIDEMMLEHVLFNLLQNAFKYSLNRPAPVCRLKILPHYWSVIIVDSGIGISAEDEKKLFDSFYRGSNATNIQGTGLGLTIVKYFTDQLNGRILIRSRLHKGTTVILQFKK